MMTISQDRAKPILVVLSAPSGAGKSTICGRLLSRNPDFRLSISSTTRKRRHTETEGVHYFFLDKDEFDRRIERGDFLEYAEVHGNYYGTSRVAVETMLADGFTVLFDIDVKGARSIRESFPDALLIFIRPPSLDELRRRLRDRGTDSEAEIERRLERLPREYEAAGDFDVQVINDTLDQTIAEIELLIRNHRRK